MNPSETAAMRPALAWLSDFIGGGARTKRLQPENRAAAVEAVADPPEPFAGATALVEAARLDAEMIKSLEFGAAGPLPRTAGRFKILRRIGEGAMGEVFEAEHAASGQVVALKVIKHGRRASFIREMRALRHLEHPNIARLYDVGLSEEGRHFISMELIRGARPLTLYLREERTGLTDVLRLFQVVCAATQYMHQKSVTHLDLKPNNILVDAEGLPKIVDFGLAKIIEGQSTDATLSLDESHVRGTVDYMSTEQLDGISRAIDTRSDVYALGVILFELLTGKLPFDLRRRSLVEAARIVRETPAPRPSRMKSARDRLGDIYRDLDTIVLTALSKSPAERYDSPAEMAADIQRYLDHEPIPRKRGWGYRTFKFAHRHAVVLAVAISLPLVFRGGYLVLTQEMTQALEVESRIRDALSWSKDPDWLRARAQQLTDDPANTRQLAALRSEAKMLSELRSQYADRLAGIFPGNLANAGKAIALRTRLVDLFRQRESTLDALAALEEMDAAAAGLDRVKLEAALGRQDLELASLKRELALILIDPLLYLQCEVNAARVAAADEMTQPDIGLIARLDRKILRSQRAAQESGSRHP